MRVDEFYMGLVARNPVFKISDQVMLKLACSATQISKDIETSHRESLITILQEIPSSEFLTGSCSN